MDTLKGSDQTRSCRNFRILLGLLSLGYAVVLLLFVALPLPSGMRQAQGLWATTLITILETARDQAAPLPYLVGGLTFMIFAVVAWINTTRMARYIAELQARNADLERRIELQRAELGQVKAALERSNRRTDDLQQFDAQHVHTFQASATTVGPDSGVATADDLPQPAH